MQNQMRGDMGVYPSHTHLDFNGMLRLGFNQIEIDTLKGILMEGGQITAS